MNHSKPLLGTAFFLLACLFGPLASAGDSTDTRLSFIISEDNFFAGPGETQNNSPGIGIGGGKQNTLFFDNYDTKFTGFETMSHLVLYKKMPSFFENLTTEAALVIRFQIFSEQTYSYLNQFYDAGSYIRLTYDLSQGLSNNKNLQFVLFPISGDRFRLGYSYRISWGGSNVFPLYSKMVPAAKIQINLPWGYGFLGVKTTQLSENVGNTNQTELVTNYGVLGGLGVDIEGFRAEMNGGFFTRGNFPHEGVRGERLYGSGVSYQLGYHQGMEIGTSIDFSLYKNDPEIDNRFFKPEEYGPGVSFVLKHEGSFLFHTLIDPDNYGTTVNQKAYAFDLNFAMKTGFWRFHADAMVRTLSFLLFEVPSFTPYYDFPAQAEIRPEYFLAAGADYHFPDLHLTTGFVIGVQHPATYTIDNLTIGEAQFSGRRTVVIRDIASRSVLPTNEAATLIYSVKGTVRWDLSEMLAIVAEFYFTYDDNRTRYVSDITGLNIDARWDDPNILGVNLVAQARF
jgi:hypothetical protein